VEAPSNEGANGGVSSDGANTAQPLSSTVVAADGPAVFNVKAKPELKKAANVAAEQAGHVSLCIWGGCCGRWHSMGVKSLKLVPPYLGHV